MFIKNFLYPPSVFLFLFFPDCLLADTEGSELVFDDATNTYLLRVPRVNALDAPGYYQEALFETTRPNDASTWRLLSVEKGEPLRVDHAELVMTNEMPVQVFLRADGWMAGCREIGQVAIEANENDFSVSVYYAPSTPAGEGCFAAMEYFVKSIPLPVYALKAGTYTYSVNGGNAGKFELSEDNVFTEDRKGTAGPPAIFD
jgi:hypothetical protein